MAEATAGMPLARAEATTFALRGGGGEPHAQGRPAGRRAAAPRVKPSPANLTAGGGGAADGGQSWWRRARRRGGPRGTAAAAWEARGAAAPWEAESSVGEGDPRGGAAWTFSFFCERTVTRSV